MCLQRYALSLPSYLASQQRKADAEDRADSTGDSDTGAEQSGAGCGGCGRIHALAPGLSLYGGPHPREKADPPSKFSTRAPGARLRSEDGFFAAHNLTWLAGIGVYNVSVRLAPGL